MVIEILFITVFILGVVAGLYALKVTKDAIDEVRGVLKFRAYGIMMLSAGYIIHTLGDLLSTYYGKGVELLLESAAHGLILVAFILFYKTARQAVDSSRGYWFK